MKLYSSDAGARMQIGDDPRLRALLRHVIKSERITHVVETGTFLGLGSTTLVAESFPAGFPPEAFVTIEARWQSWCQARRNLSRFPFVHALWGTSVPIGRALEFIRDDELLRHHERYEGIFIDDVVDPVAFYSAEVRGELGGVSLSWRGALRMAADRVVHYAGSDLLRHYLLRFGSENPLIILDSAGGIGFLEFFVLLETIPEDPYVLLMDDIHHVKHYRSMQHVSSDPRFVILGQNMEHGWALVKHVAARTCSCVRS
jgi:hypothetical protein